jgi:hypothetical protein
MTSISSDLDELGSSDITLSTDLLPSMLSTLLKALATDKSLPLGSDE